MLGIQTVEQPLERFSVIFGRCHRCHEDYIKHVPISKEFPDQPCFCGAMADH